MRERSDACLGLLTLDSVRWPTSAGSGAPSPGLRPPSPVKGEGQGAMLRFVGWGLAHRSSPNHCNWICGSDGPRTGLRVGGAAREGLPPVIGRWHPGGLFLAGLTGRYDPGYRDGFVNWG